MSMYAQCMHNVYTMRTPCIYHAYTVHAQCIHNAYTMHIYTVHIPCIHLRHVQAAQRGELARLLPSPGGGGASQRNVVLDVANLGHHTASNATPRFGRDCRWHRYTPLA